MDQIQVLAVLYPAVAEAAARAGARAVGLVDVGGSGASLDVDRAFISYSNGQTLGDPSSAVQVACTVRGGRPVPARGMPSVVSRAGVDVAGMLPDALAGVAAGVLPVVVTTWALSRLPLEGRLRFLQRLDAAATGRAVAWVSVEGVGVAPAMPTFGDRPASGHSVVGVAVFRHSELRAEGVGRCWSRGRWLAWLA